MLNALLTFIENNFLVIGIVLLGIILFSVVLIVLILKSKHEKKTEKHLTVTKIENTTNDVKQNDTQELEDLEKSKAKLELQKMLDQMQMDLDNKMEQAVSNFEQEQEEKSIISYQELLKSVNKTSVENISLIDVELEEQNIKEIPTNYRYNYVPKEQEEKKFKSTEFISPIYGIVENNSKFPHIPLFDRNKEEIIEKKEVDKNIHNRTSRYEKEYETIPQRQQTRTYSEFSYPDKNYELERTLNMDLLSDEIKRNEEFLRTLKEFRKNL